MGRFRKEVHRTLPFMTKIKILNEVAKGTRKKSEIARDFKIPKSKLSTIIKNRPKILMASKTFGKKRFRARKSKWPELDAAMYKWVKDARNKNIPLSGPFLKEKAETFASRLGIDNFKISEGWLSRFKRRNDLVFRRVCGEGASVNISETEDWKETRLKEVLQDYSPDDIYNADETGLFYKQLPNSTIALKGESCIGGKLSKERLTVLVCTNMSGTDKLKLLVIGKFKRPRCFKGIATLPVTYRNNKSAWMTSELFVEWVREQDLKFHRQNRKVMLFVDNCSAHCHIEDLRAITLEFFPPNATAVLQPCDQGIILNMKKMYRHRLLRRLLLNMDNQKTYEVDILKAIFLLKAAWDAVQVSTIMNCFKHCGFVALGGTDPPLNSALEVEDNPDGNLRTVITELNHRQFPFPRDFDVDSYIEIDSCLVVSSEVTDESITQEIISNREQSESDKEDDSLPPRKPKKDEVLQAIEMLNSYISMENECSTIVNRF